MGAVAEGQRVEANGIEIYVDSFGDADDPVLLMIGGLGAQCTRYDDELCLGFVDRGFRVVRYDNRDVGLSSHLPDGPGYVLADMAADGVATLDALGIERAHLFGCSMGGMIAQLMAIEHPSRVATLTSVMSSTGEPDVGQPRPEILGELLALNAPSDSAEQAVERGVELARLIGSPDHFDEEWYRARFVAFVDRAYDPAGVGRQLMAMVSSPHRAAELAMLDVPTLVIHGDIDPLIDISGGRRTAELVPGARFVEIEGMGHDLPPAMWSRYVESTTALVSSNV